MKCLKERERGVVGFAELAEALFENMDYTYVEDASEKQPQNWDLKNTEYKLRWYYVDGSFGRRT